MRIHKQKLMLAVLPWLVTNLVRLWFGTVRVKVIDRDIFDRYFTNNQETGHVVAGAWHRNAIFFFYYFRKLKNACIMVSSSKDGDFVSGVARRFGYDVIRGSSSRGGRSALLNMVEYLREKSEPAICGTPVDGPRGPARQMKKGMLVLARDAGAWFVPMACSGSRVITFHKAWDKTIIPLPFSKMVLTFGTPIRIAEEATADELEQIRKAAEKDLDAITDRADAITGYGSNPPPASCASKKS